LSNFEDRNYGTNIRGGWKSWARGVGCLFRKRWRWVESRCEKKCSPCQYEYEYFDCKFSRSTSQINVRN